MPLPPRTSRLAMLDARGRSVAAIVLVLVVDATVVVALDDTTRHSTLPSGIMLLGVVGATLLSGRVAGLLSAALATFTLYYVFLPERSSFALDSSAAVERLVTYAVVLAVLVLLISQFRRIVDRLRAVEAELDGNLSMVQRALLPGPVPLVDGIELGRAYRPAAGRDAGGDWYTIVPLGHGRIGLGIGDAAGHGLDAIGSMARSRFTMLAYALDDLSPADVLCRANESVVATAPPPGLFATATYGVIDLYRKTWIEARAGHPPTIVRRSTGCTEVLEQRAGLPLGIDRGAKYAETLVELDDGDILALYTDGLIDWPARDVDRGIATLRGRLTDRVGDELTTACEQLANDLGNPADDVAVLLARVDLTVAAR